MSDISDQIAFMRARDARIAILECAVDLDIELANSKALSIVLTEADRQATMALEALATVNPTDTNRIIELQSVWYRAKFIRATLNDVLEQGRIAQHSLDCEANGVDDE